MIKKRNIRSNKKRRKSRKRGGERAEIFQKKKGTNKHQEKRRRRRWRKMSRVGGVRREEGVKYSDNLSVKLLLSKRSY